jgi:diadenosine tetraphosphatase ApaH/serine/threonine PP2A family protein phosphatase
VTVLAIVSDIHSNIEALEAVMKDAEAEGAEEFRCLGDVIGYGPNPVECVDIARSKFEFTLLGNHEEAVLFGAIGFNPKAKMAIDWTREQFHVERDGLDERNARWQFLGELPLSVEGNDKVQYVHGSPRDPTREYVFPTDVLNPDKLQGIFAHVELLTFNGHTHAPGVMTEEGIFRLPQDLNNVYTLAEEKVIINVGSVGQPRDGDNRASYAIFDGEKIRFRRVVYDIEKVMARMNRIDRLPEYLALRLKEGR